VKMMHFGVFCIQFHRPRARMNKISNVLESSIALAAVAGRRLAARLFHCSITNGEAVNKQTRQRPGTLESAGSSTRCDPAHFKHCLCLMMIRDSGLLFWSTLFRYIRIGTLDSL